MSGDYRISVSGQRFSARGHDSVASSIMVSIAWWIYFFAWFSSISFEYLWKLFMQPMAM